MDFCLKKVDLQFYLEQKQGKLLSFREKSTGHTTQKKVSRRGKNHFMLRCMYAVGSSIREIALVIFLNEMTSSLVYFTL